MIFVIALAVAININCRGTYDRGLNTFGTMAVGTFFAFFISLLFTGLFFDHLSYQTSETKKIVSPISAGLVNHDYTYQFMVGDDLSLTSIPDSKVVGVSSLAPPSLTTLTTCTNAWGWGGCSGSHTYTITTGAEGLVARP